MAAWYCQNGTASMAGAFFVWALSHNKHPSLHLYQITFIFTGALTVLFVPVAWAFWDEKPEKAGKWLTPEDRAKAVERLKANQTASNTNKFRKSFCYALLSSTDADYKRHAEWSQVKELFLDPKTYLFGSLAILCSKFATTSDVRTAIRR